MSGLAERQREFARHIRHPAVYPAPADVEPRRMRIYNELIYNTVEGFVAGGFPVLRSLLADEPWHALVRRFVDEHRCQTPYFLRIAEEFIDFVGARGAAVLGLPPFTEELINYEWVELALDVAEDEAPAFLPGADPMSGIAALSPLAWPLAYAWPVQRICREMQPAVPPPLPTCLVVYRDRAERVQFIETNPATLRLLELAAEGRRTGRELLGVLAGELGDAGVAVSAEAGQETLLRLAELGIIGIRGSEL